MSHIRETNLRTLRVTNNQKTTNPISKAVTIVKAVISSDPAAIVKAISSVAVTSSVVAISPVKVVTSNVINNPKMHSSPVRTPRART